MPGVREPSTGHGGHSDQLSRARTASETILRCSGTSRNAQPRADSRAQRIYPLRSEEDRPKLEEELAHEIDRVRSDYPEEWKFFGDITPQTVLKHVGGRKEPQWFKAEWPDGSVTTVAGLATKFGYKWEYDFLYDVFSALVHSRGIKQDLTIENNTVSVHHPHTDEWFQMLAYFTLSWHVLVLLTAAKWSVPEMIPQVQDLYTRHKKDWEALAPQEPPRMLT